MRAGSSFTTGIIHHLGHLMLVTSSVLEKFLPQNALRRMYSASNPKPSFEVMKLWKLDSIVLLISLASNFESPKTGGGPNSSCR